MYLTIIKLIIDILLLVVLCIWIIKITCPKKAASKWIPVSEKLPENSGDYLIAIADSNYTNGQYYNISWFYPSSKKWSYRNAVIIAWMPLPEPYSYKKVKNADSD